MTQLDSAEFRLVSDKQQLADLVSRLSRGIDRGDREVIEACYAPDGYDDHGIMAGSGQEFAANVCAVAARSRFLFHNLGQSLFDVEGDEAFGETYVAFWMQRVQGTVEQTLSRYIDYCQRIDGQWLIKHRKVLIDWRGEISVCDVPPGTGYIVGRSDRLDASYLRFRQRE